MLNIDADAIICDLAETYGIYNYESLPPLTVAVFCIGLRDNSRIKLKMTNQPVDLNTLLLASMVDRLSYLLWMKTDDARHGFNRPECIVDKLTNKTIENDIQGYSTAADFEKALAELQENKRANYGNNR